MSLEHSTLAFGNPVEPEHGILVGAGVEGIPKLFKNKLFEVELFKNQISRSRTY